MQKTEFHLHSSDLRLWISQFRKGLYSDVMLIAPKPLLNDDRDNSSPVSVDDEQIDYSGDRQSRRAIDLDFINCR